MVDLDVREETSALLGVVARFAIERVRPTAADAEVAMRPAAGLAEGLRQIGVVPGVGEEHGGQGELTAEDLLLVTEAVAYGDPGTALELLAPGQAALLIARAGTDQQRSAYLPRLAAGESACVLYYEGFGRGPSELATTAVADGDAYVLNGRKIGVVRPADTDLAVVVATVGAETAAFVLERDEITALTTWRDDQSSGKLGARAARTGVVDLQGVRIPADRRLTSGVDLAEAIALLRVQLAAIVLGGARASHDYAREYTSQRAAFGRPIIDYQGVAFPLADVLIGLEANRLNLLALTLDLDTLADPEAIATRTTLVVNRVFKFALDATRIGINSLGGHGYLMDHPQERWHRAVATLGALDFDPLASDLDAI
ncbi:acyl-CoA dehydrogenase family protein [Streptomyces sp. NPDC002920]